jgi:hypothetical protein
MTWLSWRQSRVQISVILTAVTLLALVAAGSRPHLVGLASVDHDSFLARAAAERVNGLLYLTGIIALYAVPPLIGAFWGAPLIARELETGTHRLVWNQSVTRNRWLAAKMGLAGGAGVVAAGVPALAVTWWAGPVDRAVADGRSARLFALPRIHPVIFAARGVVPVGYALLALAVGVVAGLLLRRSVPAMAVTLAVVVAVQVAVPLLVRPHLATPHRETVAISADNLRGMMSTGDDPGSPRGLPAGPVEQLTVRAGGPGDWMLTNRTVDAAGHEQHRLPSWVAGCGRFGTMPAQQTACFGRLLDAGYRQSVAYQPGAGFWALQLRETALLVLAALLLTGLCFARIRRTA